MINIANSNNINVLTCSCKINDKKNKFYPTFQGNSSKLLKNSSSKNNFFTRLKSFFCSNDIPKEIVNTKHEIYLQNQKRAYELLPNKGSNDIIMMQVSPEQYIYYPLQMECYDVIRYCRSNPYELRNTCSENITDIVSKSNDNISVKLSQGWYYRRAKNYTSNNLCVERLSLNVYPEKELIEKLDNFLCKTGVAAEYKVPNENNEWLVRHENIILYFDEKLSPKLKQELVDIIKPYTRQGKEEMVLGTKLADGIYQVNEPTPEEVNALLERARELDFDNGALVNFLLSPKAYLFNKYGQVNTSPAIVKSVELMLNKLEKIKVNENLIG